MLLEAGFLTMFYIPSRAINNIAYSDDISITVRELLRWMAFRIHFSNGLVKFLA